MGGNDAAAELLHLIRLSKHPAYVPTDRRLQCDVCHRWHQTVESYDADYLAHDPTADEAWRRLSGPSYILHAEARGWPSAILPRQRPELDPPDGPPQ